MTNGLLTLVSRSETLARSIVKHDPRYDFCDWAEKFLETPNGQRFRWWPHQHDPARDMFDRRVTRLALRWYSGGGKTYMIGGGFTYGVKELREKGGFMLPNAQDAEDWMKDEFMPLVNSSPAMRSIRITRDLVRLKTWENGGYLAAIGANQDGRIRRLQAALLYADEADAVKAEHSKGDKVDDFFKRSRGRKRQHQWVSSYPSRKGFSKIDSECESADLFNRVVKCWRCSTPYIMHTRQIVWTPKKPETAVLYCPHCERSIEEAARFDQAMAAEWRNAEGRTRQQTRDDGYSGRVAYHLGCMYHVGDYNDEAHVSYMHEIASEIEKLAQSDNPEKAKRVFVNTRDAESYEEELMEKPEANAYYDRREAYNPYETLPAGVLMLRGGIDVQGNRLEAVIVGFGQNDEEWGVSYRVIPGSPLKTSTWEAARKFMDNEFSHPSGKRLKVSGVCVDSGWRQDDVLKAIRNIPKWWAVKGAIALGKPIIGKPSVVGRPPTHQYQVGTHEAKDQIYQRARLTKDPEAAEYPKGFMHFPKIEEFGPSAGGEATGFFEMLFAEDATEKKAPSGEWLPFYECRKGQRNEALDVWVYAKAAAKIFTPNFEKLSKWMWSNGKQELAENQDG
jgi:phage terminase large subunit GpA-like protein